MARWLLYKDLFITRALRVLLISFLFLFPALLIGTSFPSSVFAASSDIQAVLDSTDGTSSFAIQNSVSVDQVKITSQGKIGVGANRLTPTFQVDVSGTVAADSEFRVGTTAGSMFGSNNDLRPRVTSGYLNLLSGAGNAGISLSDTRIHFAAGGTSEKMTLDENGNLGIGTISPSTSLDVRGGARFWDGVSYDPSGRAGTRGLSYAVNSGDVYIQNNLEVDGDVYLGDSTMRNLIVMGQLILEGATSYSGSMTISADSTIALLVRNSTTGVNELEVNTSGQKVKAVHDLVVGSNVTAGGTVKAGNLTIGSGSVSDSGNNISFNGNNLSTSGTMDVASVLVNGRMTVTNGLTVTADTTLVGNAQVTGLMTIGSGLTVTADTTLNGN
ncbi:MAG: hypothetical protein HQL22_09155, partial [Candidatus Omnitrophica bacterium]|nr:hypothetical protein [Candidatus Omnitrophota bacterium]